jgi:hypothetical protein
LTVSTSSSTPTGSFTVTVTGIGGGKSHTTQFRLTVNSPPFDFSLSNSGGVTVTHGGSGSTRITVALTSGSTQAVILLCGGLPSGVSCSFSPQIGHPTFTSTLTIKTSSSTPRGSYTITVTSGGVPHTTQFTLTIT